MKRFAAVLLLLTSATAHAWGTSGFAYMQPQPPAPQPVQANPDNYNQGYTDGYNASNGYTGRNGYGPNYERGYDDARRAQQATYRLNHPQ